jgi:thymidylate synthase ThyX
MEEDEKDETQQLLNEAIAVQQNAHHEQRGVNFYTRMFHSSDGHNLGHLLRLRDDPHAQHEIREPAKVVKHLMRAHLPHMAEAQRQHNWEAVKLSVAQQEHVRSFDGNIREAITGLVEHPNYSQFIKDDNGSKTEARTLSRQGQNFLRKLEKLIGEE